MTPVNPALVLRRELPGDEEPTRALHDAAFGVPDGAEHSARDRTSSTGCVPTGTCSTR